LEADIKGRLGLERRFKKKATGRYPLEEKELFGEVTARRKNGRKVSSWWISRRMRHLVRKTDPTSMAVFGNNWLYRFVRRWGLSWRKATKQKQKIIESRLERIKRFHQGLRKLLRDSEGQRGARELDPKWGRFLPQHRFNWDEIPWAFIGGLSHTWDMKVLLGCLFQCVLECRVQKRCTFANQGTARIRRDLRQ
jgi:hypothetical protein